MRAAAFTAVVVTALGSGPLAAAGDPSGSPREEKPPAGTVVELSDSDILGVLDAANSAAVEQGTIAEMKAQSDGVMAFARRMVADHNAEKRKTESVAHDVGLTPVSSPVSSSIKKEAQAVALRLHKASSATFDQEYMESQIAFHEQLLKLLEEDLIPQADAPKVKSLVGGMKEHVERHLALAREIARAPR